MATTPTLATQDTSASSPCLAWAEDAGHCQDSVADSCDVVEVTAARAAAAQASAAASDKACDNGDGVVETLAEGLVRWNGQRWRSQAIFAGGRTPEALLARGSADADGFAADELRRMRRGFASLQRGEDLARSELPRLLVYLGYLAVDEHAVEDMAAEMCEFDTLDFKDFVELASRHASREGEVLRDSYEEVVACPGARSVVTDVSKALRAIGVEPQSAAITEAATRAGLAKKEVLNEDELQEVLAAFQATEGCHAKEVARGRHIFDELALAKRVPAAASHVGASAEDSRELALARLPEALLRVAGVQAAGHVRSLVDRFGLPVEGAEALNIRLGFAEFLIWIRLLRESMLHELRQPFDQADPHGVGLVADELPSLARELGMTLRSEAVGEFLAGAGCSGRCSLDFDDFVAFVQTARSAHGFCAEEVQGFSRMFARVDDNNNGEIDVLELVAMLRDLGYSTSLEDSYRLLSEVDANQNGALCFDEFLWFMRLHREMEMASAASAFEKHIEPGLKARGLSSQVVVEALRSLSLTPRSTKAREKVPQTFESFVSTVDSCRHAAAMEARRRAAFTREEVTVVQRHFDRVAAVRCAAGAASDNVAIEAGELTLLLIEFGVPMGTTKQRSEVLQQVPAARSEAQAAGVAESLLGEPGPGGAVGTTTVWTLLHLLRRLVVSSERAAVGRELKAMQETGFSHAEVAEFREIFAGCVHAAQPDQHSEGPVVEPSGRPRLVERRKSVSSIVGTSASTDAPGTQRSCRDAMPVTASTLLRHASRGTRVRLLDLRRLLSNLGLKMPVEQQAQLAARFVDFLPFADEAADSAGCTLAEGRVAVPAATGKAHDTAPVVQELDFPGFLRLMKWMLDVNFADINGMAEQVLCARVAASASPHGSAARTPVSRRRASV